MSVVDRTLAAIDAGEHAAADAIERASRDRDDFTRARAALNSIKSRMPAQAIPRTDGAPSAPHPGPTVLPETGVRPTRSPRRAKKERARAVRRKAKRAHKRIRATPAHDAPAPEPITAADAPAPAPAKPKPEKVKPKLPGLDDHIIQIAREHPGKSEKTIVTMVCFHRKLAGSANERRVRLKVRALVEGNKLHANPDGQITAA